jgi:hypothetical protein
MRPRPSLAALAVGTLAGLILVAGPGWPAPTRANNGIPLPTLPLPTLPLPSLPFPTVRATATPSLPSLPLPTPTASVVLPTPTSAPPLPTATGAAPTVSSSPSASPTPGIGATARPRPAPIIEGPSPTTSPAGTVAAGGLPPSAEPRESRTSQAPSIGEVVVPALAVGVPAILVVVLLIIQLGIGAAWLPVARRMLGSIGLGAWRRQSRG